MNSPLSSSFLMNKSVLITGTTGFIGKAILELILSDHYPHINFIYLLIRSSEHKNIREKYEEVMSNKIFSILQDSIGIDEYWSMVKSKVVPVEGDLCNPGIIVNNSDYLLIKKDVNYVIHCAANTDLEGGILSYYEPNIMGTRRIMDLCDQLNNCLGFQYISTAYSSCNLASIKNVHELVYPMNISDPKVLLESIPNLGEKEISELTKKVAEVYPNINVFIKSLSEHSILSWVDFMKNRELQGVKQAWPINIIRPTIVSNTAYYPFPGWTDGVNINNATILFGAMGALDTFQGERDSIMDSIPVDYLVRLMIKACAIMSPPGTDFNLAYFEENNFNNNNEQFYPQIYHATSSSINPVSMYTMSGFMLDASTRLPVISKRLFELNSIKHKNEALNSITHSLKSNIRNSLQLAGSVLSSHSKTKKSKTKKFKLINLNRYFKSLKINQWLFEYNNTEKMDNFIVCNSLSNIIESNSFSISKLRNLSWERFCHISVYGVYYYVLRESEAMRIQDIIPEWECSLSKVKPLPNQNIKVLRAKSTRHANAEKSPINNTLLLPNTVSKRRSQWKRLSFIIEKVKLPEELSPELKKEILNLSKTKEQTFNSANSQKFKKFLNQNFSSLIVNLPKLNQIRYKITECQSDPRVIYIPTFNSLLDSLILCYLTQKYDLPKPQVIVEGGSQIVNYGLINDSILIKNRHLKKCNNSSNSSLIEEYMIQTLYSGGSIALFQKQSPTENCVPNQKLNVNLLHSLISRIRRIPDMGPIYIIPINTGYEIPLDQDYLIKEWCSQSHQPNEQINLSLKEKGISSYFNFDEPILVCPVDEDFKSNSIDFIINKVESIKEKTKVITTTSILSTILLFYKSLGGGLKLSTCRRLMRYLKVCLSSFGYLMDWSDEEDLNSVLHHAIQLIGPEHIEIINAENDHLIQTKQSINTGLLLEILAQSASQILASIGVWYASYIICHIESMQDNDPDSDIEDNSSNQLITSKDPKVIDLLDTYKTVVEALISSVPSLRSISQGPIEKSFNNIIVNMENGRVIQTDSSRVKLNESPISSLFLNICLYYLNPGFFIIEGILINIIDSSHLIVPRSKLLIQWTGESTKLKNNILTSNLNNFTLIDKQVIKWWSKILLINNSL